MRNEYLSECCYSPFTEPNYPNTDICCSCYEHSGLAEIEE